MAAGCVARYSERGMDTGEGGPVSNVIPFPRRISSVDREAAERLFHEAALIDEDPTRFLDAAALYHASIKLDPVHSWDSWTNLGSMMYRAGWKRQAAHLWRRAIHVSKECEGRACPLALYNLGHLQLDQAQDS